MQKTILITGATDGIGLESAKLFVEQGHHVLIHGRNPEKLTAVEKQLTQLQSGHAIVESYVADLSSMSDTAALAQAVINKHHNLDVLINNAGVLRTSDPVTGEGFDVRFLVNTLAPYLLFKKLQTVIPSSGRVVNLSSAAQAPVNIKALMGGVRLGDMDAYAQSKLAITMWSRVIGVDLKTSGPLVVSVNPGSLLATKMVKEGFGVAGHDIGIGAAILVRAALSDEFVGRGGEYFDNDANQFADPHRDALDTGKSEQLVQTMETLLDEIH
jgi:NAD(P)-dependent dehydrogenase (short-subunit alcohol dehydrogenase family)